VSAPVWTGGWVTRRLGVQVLGDDVVGLVGLAVRRNPRRAHLLVSGVLGKHVPTDPRRVRAAGWALGARVAAVLDGGDPGPATAALLEPDAAAARDAALAAGRAVPGVVVLGYCETATGLGHLVAESLRAPSLHSTRRPVPGVPTAGGFDEEHSHAVGHLLLPGDPALLTGDGPLVLVDDELSTGRTVANTLRALHALHARARYVVAALVDLRSAADRAELAALADELGARVDVVALAVGEVAVPDGVLEAGRALVASLEPAAPAPGATEPAPAAAVTRVALGWPAGVPEGGRHGVTAASHDALDAALPAVVAPVLAALPDGAGSLLVLGFEELMHAPLRVAEAVADARPDLAVRFSTTTRSPVLPVDDPGYAIRDALVFPAHDDPADGPGPRFAYNTAGAADVVLVVVDGPADTPALHAEGGLLARLAAGGPAVLLAVLPVHLPPGAAAGAASPA
jgi:hypothetical protein